MIQNEFSIIGLSIWFLVFIIAFVGLILLMKLGDRLIFWFKTKDALPFIPEEEYKVGQVVRHFNVYLKVSASSGSCTGCYFNTGRGCTNNNKCADFSRKECKDYIIYKRIYK